MSEVPSRIDANHIDTDGVPHELLGEATDVPHLDLTGDHCPQDNSSGEQPKTPFAFYKKQRDTLSKIIDNWATDPSMASLGHYADWYSVKLKGFQTQLDELRAGHPNLETRYKAEQEQARLVAGPAHSMGVGVES